MGSITSVSTRHRGAMALCVALLCVSCQDDPKGPPDLPLLPPLPRGSSLDTDTDFFVQQPLPDDSAGEHYWYAAQRVLNTRAVTEPVLGVPETLLRAAALHTPVLDGEAWHWRFTVHVAGAPYTTDITGRVQGEESVWHVRVTAPNHGVVNGLWYDGRARLDGTAGSWRVYHVQSQPEKVLASIDWSHPTLDVWTVGLAEHGLLRPPDSSRTSYTLDGTRRLLASTSFIASIADTARFDAGWDAVGRHGFVSTGVYHGGAVACWGARLQNVVCPP